jgi:hypothetical protein
MASGVDKRGRVSSSRRNPKRSAETRKRKRYHVAKGTQVHHEGRVYAEGERLEATVEEAFAWVAVATSRRSASSESFRVANLVSGSR